MNTAKKLNIALFLGILDTISLIFATSAQDLYHLISVEIILSLFVLIKIISVLFVILILREIKASILLILSFCIIVFFNTLITSVLLYVLFKDKLKQTKEL